MFLKHVLPDVDSKLMKEKKQKRFGNDLIM